MNEPSHDANDIERFVREHTEGRANLLAGEFIDVECVIASCALSEHLRLAGGKMHTPSGHWNNARGQAISWTIDRPCSFASRTMVGALPVHTTGAELSGRDMGSAHLGFDLLEGMA